VSGPTPCSLANSAIQECGDLAGTLYHRRDLDGTAFSAVNHEVCTDRPEQNGVRGQVFAPVSDAWTLSEGFKRIEQFFDPAVSGVEIVRGDRYLPDLSRHQR
jgi:hypothetical protein